MARPEQARFRGGRGGGGWRPSRRQGGEGEIEGGDLGAAVVDFEAEQVVAQHRRHRFLAGQVFFGHAQGHQDGQRKDQEMAGTHAGIQQGEFLRRPGPAGKGAGRRAPGAGRAALARRADEAEVAPFHAREGAGAAQPILVGGGGRQGGIGGQTFARPPGAQGVMEQEEDHVVLGEELGDGGELDRRRS